MILYLLKSGICLVVFAAAYALLLQREKMHHFKRFYLVGSLAFAFLIPLVTFEFEPHALHVEKLPNLNQFSASPTFETAVAVAETERFLSVETLVLLSYLLVTAAFLFRFVRNLISLFRLATGCPNVFYQEAQLVLLDEKTLPYTFLHWIFINKDDYQNGVIEPQLYTHELIHVHQRHTLDVLFIELLRIIFWFNPLLLWFRKAIKTNHEFLADDGVNTQYADVPLYQRLLLSKLSYQTSQVVSSLTFQTTKQRFIMMTKQTSQPKATLLKLAVLVPFLVLTLTLSLTIAAQQPDVIQQDTVKAKGSQTAETKKATYYKNATFYMKYKQGKAVRKTYAELTAAEKQMIGPPVPPLPKVIPTEAQLDEWKNSKKFGVWVDDKRINNDALKNYSANDFASYFISKLEKNAINYGKHYYQVDLMTHANYQEYLKKREESPTLVIRNYK